MVRKRQHKNLYHNPEIESIKACFTDTEAVYVYEEEKETN